MGRKPAANTWERTLYRKIILKSERHSLVGGKKCLCNNGEQFKIARGQLTALLSRQSHVCQCLPCTPPVLLVKGCSFLIDTGQRWKEMLYSSHATVIFTMWFLLAMPSVMELIGTVVGDRRERVSASQQTISNFSKCKETGPDSQISPFSSFESIAYSSLNLTYVLRRCQCPHDAAERALVCISGVSQPKVSSVFAERARELSPRWCSRSADWATGKEVNVFEISTVLTFLFHSSVPLSLITQLTKFLLA